MSEEIGRYDEKARASRSAAVETAFAAFAAAIAARWAISHFGLTASEGAAAQQVFGYAAEFLVHWGAELFGLGFGVVYGWVRGYAKTFWAPANGPEP